MRHAAEILIARLKRRVGLAAALALLTAMTAAPAAADEYFCVVNSATKMMAEVFAHNMAVVLPWCCGRTMVATASSSSSGT